MRKIGLLLFIIFITSNPFFSQKNHTRWTYEYDQDMQVLMVYGRLDEGWHTYSQKTKKNAGPIPVTISINKNKDIKVVSKQPQEISPSEKVFDKNFESDVYLFNNIYIGYIKIKVKRPTTISGIVNFMVCDDTQCLPPIDLPFSIKVVP